jgi:hypothetical protein
MSIEMIPQAGANQKRGLGHEDMMADSFYGSDENGERAKEPGVDVISTVMRKLQGKPITLTEVTLTLIAEFYKTRYVIYVEAVNL